MTRWTRSWYRPARTSTWRPRSCSWGGMACRRGGRPTGFWLRAAVVAAALAMMLAQVWVANGIVEHRTAVARLAAEREYLVTRVGALRLAWHRRTSREVITARAARELGLAEGDGPAPLLLVQWTPGRPEEDVSWWRRLVAAVGSGRGVATVTAGEREP